MITYDEALKKARELNPIINNCVEYTDAYIFGDNEGEEVPIGGPNAPVVIMKSDGKAYNISYYMAMLVSDEKYIKEFKVK